MSENVQPDKNRKTEVIIVVIGIVLAILSLALWFFTLNIVLIVICSILFAISIFILIFNLLEYKIDTSSIKTSIGTISGPTAVLIIFVYFSYNGAIDLHEYHATNTYSFTVSTDSWVAVNQGGQIVPVGISGTNNLSSGKNIFNLNENSVSYNCESDELVFYRNGVILGKYTLPELVALIGKDAVIDLSYINEQYGVKPYKHSSMYLFEGFTDELNEGDQFYEPIFNTGIPFKISFEKVVVKDGRISYSELKVINKTDSIETPKELRDFGGFFHLVGNRLFFIKVLEAYHQAADFNKSELELFRKNNKDATDFDIDEAIRSGLIKQKKNYIKLGIVEIASKY